MGMSKKNGMERALRAIDELRREVGETSPEELDCRGIEDEIQARLHAVGRELMREVLLRADAQQAMVTINGKPWGNRRESPGTYTTLFGDVELPRGIYSQAGGGRVAVPLDLRLGIVEKRYTPRVARVLTRATALMTDEEAEGFLREVGVAQVSKSTLHRMPRAVAARYETQREQIQQELRESDEVPDDAVTLQVSLDGVMVPQDGEHAKRRGRKTDTPQPARHEARYGPVEPGGPSLDDGVEGRAWHEATVGTVSFWDKKGEHLKTVYLARMPESGKGTLADELEDEVHAALAERPDLDICFAADGDAHQWSLLEGIGVRLPGEAASKVTYLLDFYHAAEYLKLAANAVEGKDTPAALVLAVHWGETLKEYDDGAARVLKSMRYHRDGLIDAARREDMEKAIEFLAKQARRGRLGYAAARKKKRPIGTGVVEAAAKTVVNVRMKRAGARFSQHGGQTVMIFRTALLSERFDRLSHCLERTYTARVEAA